jgi:hypothetical protein
MPPSLRLRRFGLRSLGWALGLVLAGALLGLGLNNVSPVGINLHIALGLDEPPTPAAPAPGAKP